MFNSASLFGRPETGGPASGITRQPANNGMLGQFDIQQAIQYLQQMYPEADMASIQSMAQAQIGNAQQVQQSALDQQNQLTGGGGGANFSMGGGAGMRPNPRAMRQAAMPAGATGYDSPFNSIYSRTKS